MTGAVLVSAATSIKSDEPNIGLAAFPTLLLIKLYSE